jgi:hypothetical protein
VDSIQTISIGIQIPILLAEDRLGYSEVDESSEVRVRDPSWHLLHANWMEPQQGKKIAITKMFCNIARVVFVRRLSSTIRI